MEDILVYFKDKKVLKIMLLNMGIGKYHYIKEPYQEVNNDNKRLN